jgi:hypothetical protein
VGVGVAGGVALGCGVASGVGLGVSVGDGVVTTRIVAIGDGDSDRDADADGDGDTVVAPPKRGATPKSAPTTTIVARLPAIAASTRST